MAHALIILELTLYSAGRAGTTVVSGATLSGLAAALAGWEHDAAARHAAFMLLQVRPRSTDRSQLFTLLAAVIVVAGRLLLRAASPPPPVTAPMTYCTLLHILVEHVSTSDASLIPLLDHMADHV